MKKYTLLFACGFAASVSFAQTSYQDASREMAAARNKNNGAVEVCNTCDNQQAPSVNVLSYVIGNQHFLSVKGCVPGSDVELYSASSGGQRVNVKAADEKGTASFSFRSKPKVAFALNHNRLNDAGVAGNGQLKTIGDPELVVKDMEATAAGGVRVTWKAGVANKDWTFVVQRSRDNRQFEDVGTVAPQLTNGGVTGYSFDDKEPGDAPYMYYRVRARHTSGEEIVCGDDVVKFGPKAFFTASPTVFNNSVQLVMDSDKLPATYTVTDMAGRTKYASGTVSSAKQGITLSLQPGSYIISVTDKKGRASSQILIRN
jgi:hypothetical protein